MYDFKELFLDQWLKVFASLLQAQLSGVENRKVEKLRARYIRMAELAGPELLQEFLKTGLRLVKKTAPDFAERVRRELVVRGVVKVPFRGEA